MVYSCNNYAEVNLIENFSQTKSIDKLSADELKNHLNEIRQKVNKKEISKEEVAAKVEELHKIKAKKETKDDVKSEIKKFIFDVRNHTGGMKLQGNLDLGGVMTSKAYYLSDGTKLKEIEKVVDKLALPVDKDGNFNIKSNGKKIKFDKMLVENVNRADRVRDTISNKFKPTSEIKQLHNKSRDRTVGWGGPSLQFTVNNGNDGKGAIWPTGTIVGSADPNNSGGYQGGLLFYTASGGLNKPQNLAMSIGGPDRRAYLPGNVGIGTNNPKAKLSVVKKVRADRVSHKITNNFKPTAEIKQFHHASKDGTVGWGGPSLQFTVNNGNNGGGSIWPTGTIVGSADPNNSGGYQGGLLFYTASGGLNKPQNLAMSIGGPDRRAYLPGNVGIGTNNPQAKLDVKGSNNRSGRGPSNKPALYVTGPSHPGAENQKAIAEFRHSNQTQGVGIGYNTIYATGTNRNQSLNLRAKGNAEVGVTCKNGFRVNSSGRYTRYGSLNSGWSHLITNAPQFYMNKSLQIHGAISSYHNRPLNCNRGVNVYNGRSHFRDSENKGRVRVGAAWGIPGLYSEDNQDIVIGVNRNKKVNLGYYGKFAQVDGNGNIHLPAGAKIFIGGKEVMSGNSSLIKHGDKITLASTKDNRRLQNSDYKYGPWNRRRGFATFDNSNRNRYETMKIEKCGFTRALPQNDGTANCSQ